MWYKSCTNINIQVFILFDKWYQFCFDIFLRLFFFFFLDSCCWEDDLRSRQSMPGAILSDCSPGMTAAEAGTAARSYGMWVTLVDRTCYTQLHSQRKWEGPRINVWKKREFEIRKETGGRRCLAKVEPGNSGRNIFQCLITFSFFWISKSVIRNVW